MILARVRIEYDRLWLSAPNPPPPLIAQNFQPHFSCFVGSRRLAAASRKMNTCRVFSFPLCWHKWIRYRQSFLDNKSAHCSYVSFDGRLVDLCRTTEKFTVVYVQVGLRFGSSPGYSIIEISTCFAKNEFWLQVVGGP